MFAAEFFDLGEERKEDVGFVIRNTGSGKIGEAFGALDDRADPLEAHAGVDVARGQRGESAVGVGVELDEDKIPDFDALGAALVDQRPAGVALRGEIDVQLGARTARARLTHHPEIVFLVARNDVDLRVKAGSAEMPRPIIPGFLVKLARIAR